MYCTDKQHYKQWNCLTVNLWFFTNFVEKNKIDALSIPLSEITRINEIWIEFIFFVFSIYLFSKRRTIMIFAFCANNLFIYSFPPTCFIRICTRFFFFFFWVFDMMDDSFRRRRHPIYRTCIMYSRADIIIILSLSIFLLATKLVVKFV